MILNFFCTILKKIELTTWKFYCIFWFYNKKSVFARKNSVDSINKLKCLNKASQKWGQPQIVPPFYKKKRMKKSETIAVKCKWGFHNSQWHTMKLHYSYYITWYSFFYTLFKKYITHKEARERMKQNNFPFFDELIKGKPIVIVQKKNRNPLPK